MQGSNLTSSDYPQDVSSSHLKGFLSEKQPAFGESQVINQQRALVGGALKQSNTGQRSRDAWACHLLNTKLHFSSDTPILNEH